MQVVNLTQGSAAWHAHRAAHFNASDAPAMMGCSNYTTRAELIQRLATGIVPEVDAATQRRFDDGHRFEALARPLAEAIIGEELAPLVGVAGQFSASFDGLTLMEDTAFEHKSLNDRLRAAMADGSTGADLPQEYQVQMEHQAMVSGCGRILFMASKWRLDAETGEWICEEQRSCWYTPNPELRAKIVAGWEQLEKEVAAYQPEAAKPDAIGTAPATLPALRIEIQGGVTASNLGEFKAVALERIDSIKTALITDQDFADAELAVKWCTDVEDRLKAAKEHALGQTASIDELFRAIDEIATGARIKRLALEKLVKSEKDTRRQNIVLEAQQDLDGHVAALNQRLGANWLPRMAGGFAEVIKGKKSLQNMQDAVAVALTNAKVDANALADRLEANRKHLVQADQDWITLFADFATVGAKAAEDFQALAALRIGQHKEAESKRLEVERDRIRAQEEAKAKREAEANLRAELQKKEREAQASIAQAVESGELAKPLGDDLSAVAKDAAASNVAAIDAKQVISAAQTSAATFDSSSTITLGQIKTMIAPLDITEAGLATLGFKSVGTQRAAKLFASADVPRMLAAMVKRLQTAAVSLHQAA